MGNQRVSQLANLLEGDIQSNDVFLVTDISVLESKQLEVGQLLSYFENNGIFIASNAALASTASYIQAKNIDGLEIANVVASQSISSSYSSYSNLSSQSLNSFTSSYSTWCLENSINSATASYLYYDGIHQNGTSSYSQHSLLSDTSTQAINLFYDGINPNGTASYSLTAAQTPYAVYATNAGQSVQSTNSTLATTALFSNSSTSASWATTSVYSTSASWATNSINSLSASYIGPGGSINTVVANANTANNALTAISSSYAKSASWSPSSTPTPPTILGHTWNIVNPRAAFAYSNNLYVVTQAAGSNVTGSMYVINMNTNAVSTQISANNPSFPQVQFTNNETLYSGRVFASGNRKDLSTVPVMLLNTSKGIWTFDFGSYSGDAYNFNSNVMTSLQNYLPVYADFTPNGTNNDKYPTYWTLCGGIGAGGPGQLPTLTLYGFTHAGATGSGSYTKSSSNILNLSTINNSSSFLNYFNNNITYLNATNTLLWDFNPVALRYYLIDTYTGFLHIFNSSVQISEANFTASNITYNQSYAVSLPHGEPWGASGANTTDKFIVDYDTNEEGLGTEFGLIMVRGGESSYGGTVSYIPWPANGNYPYPTSQ